MTSEQKATIDSMSQFELCKKWRFAPIRDPSLQGDIGDYFSKVLKEKGGFTPEISKVLGWNQLMPKDNELRKKRESKTFFERQQNAWFENDCRGDIEDYGYDTDFEVDDR